MATNFNDIVINATEIDGKVVFVNGKIGDIESNFNKKYGASSENKCIAVCLKILSLQKSEKTKFNNLSELLKKINITNEEQHTSFDKIKNKITDAGSGPDVAVTANTVTDTDYNDLLSILQAELQRVKKTPASDVVTPGTEVVTPGTEVVTPGTETVTPGTETVTGPPTETPQTGTPETGGGSMQNIMNRIIENKPNMTSMYPVKVTRRRYYRNGRNRRNGGNNRTNRRQRRSYSRR